MRKHLVRFIVAAAGALALVVPTHAGAIIIVDAFDGEGSLGNQAIFLSLSSADGPDVAGEVGTIVIGSRGMAPAIGTLDCAEFVPNMRGQVAFGGTLYASVMIDGNERLIRAVDRGPGGGMDEVGIIIVGRPDPNAPMCGAADVETSPLMMGDFVSGQAAM